MMTVRAFAHACVVAAGIALWDVLRNPGLIQIIAIALGILGVVISYLTILVEKATATNWATSALLTVLFEARLVLHPGDKRKPRSQSWPSFRRIHSWGSHKTCARPSRSLSTPQGERAITFWLHSLGSGRRHYF